MVHPCQDNAAVTLKMSEADNNRNIVSRSFADGCDAGPRGWSLPDTCSLHVLLI